MTTTSLCIGPDTAVPSLDPGPSPTLSARPATLLNQRHTTIPPRPRSRTNSHTQRRPAFARVEAIALVFIALVMLALLLATAPSARRQSMLNRDLANLRQIGAWTFAYANDYKDLHPSLNAAVNTTFDDIRETLSQHPLRQAVGHAIDIMRRRTGRSDIPLPYGWLPHVLFTQLVLQDYADRPLPDTMFVSTGDKHRLNWLDDPINKHDKGFWQPFQNPESGKPDPRDWRWPYSASFQTPTAWYDKSETGSRIAPSSHGSYSVPAGAIIAGHRLGDVAFPAQKVMLHDYADWHFSRQPRFFAHETSRVSVLMGDGGASPRLTADSNVGWRPNNPTRVVDRRLIGYAPRSWEPQIIDPLLDGRVFGHYRWTRGGIKGRDFDGPEVNTGQY